MLNTHRHSEMQRNRGEGDLSDSTEYQQLIAHCPELQDEAYREAFNRFVERMWTKPTSFEAYLQAYLEFSTPKKLTFGRLDDLDAAKQKKPRPARRKSRQRRSRRSKRRSTRQDRT